MEKNYLELEEVNLAAIRMNEELLEMKQQLEGGISSLKGQVTFIQNKITHISHLSKDTSSGDTQMVDLEHS